MGQYGRISAVGMDDLPVEAACKVSFITPAFSAMRTLSACIRSIREAAPPGSEVIIVVDGAIDETSRLAEQLADKVIHRPCQGGAARSRNDGARVASGDILMFVDADVTVNPEAVAGAIARLDEGADAVFGAYEALPPVGVRNLATTYKNLLHHYTHLHANQDANTFWSGFGAVRRDAFWQVGGFDPSVTTTADVEDIHLGYRLRAAGRTIRLDPSLQVQHHKRYTFRGVIESDVVHRAIPWTRAMLECKVIRPDMNLRRSAVIASLVAYAIPVALAGGALFGPGGFVLAASLIAVWTTLNFAFLVYAHRHGGVKLAVYCAALVYLYNLYCPPGAALGVASHFLHRRDMARVNWLDLDPPSVAGQGIAVSVAVIAAGDEPLHSLRGLPPVAPWWELIVVSPADRSDVPSEADFLRVPSATTRNGMRQRALETSRGEMLAFLDADCVPEPGWLDQVRAAAAGPHLVEGGSFNQDRRSVSHRAAQVSRFWHWRPERGAGWMTDHPLTNVALRRDVALVLGGFRNDGALLLRMAWFGARPVRFNPAMAVHLRSTTCARLIRGVGGAARLQSAAESRYLDLHGGMRLVAAGLAPLVAGTRLVRIVTTAVKEGSADWSFVLSVPVVAAAAASGFVGRSLGVLVPRDRGGRVARDENDLAMLVEDAFSTVGA